MLRCNQCGFENRDTDKFCSQCGAPLPTQTPTDNSFEPDDTQPVQRPSFMPPPVTPSFSQPPDPGVPASSSSAPPDPSPVEKTDFDFGRRSAVDEDSENADWKMSSLGPPPPRKRRLWLWIVLGFIVLCVVVCLGLGLWLGFTDSGQEFFDNIEATATAQAED